MHLQPHASHGFASIRLPQYERRVWVKWALWTVFLFIPVGALTGFLFGDPANGEFDTALAWNNATDFAVAVLAGVWCWVVPWTAVYFEKTNTRYRRARDPSAGPQSTGFGIAVCALVTGFFLVGPLALALAYFAWRKVAATGIRYPRGGAAIAIAAVIGTIETLWWLAVLVLRSGGFPA